MPSQRRVEREGSRISAAHLPQGRCNGQQAGGGAAGAAALYEEQLGDGTPSGGVCALRRDGDLLCCSQALCSSCHWQRGALGQQTSVPTVPSTPLHPPAALLGSLSGCLLLWRPASGRLCSPGWGWTRPEEQAGGRRGQFSELAHLWPVGGATAGAAITPARTHVHHPACASARSAPAPPV